MRVSLYTQALTLPSSIAVWWPLSQPFQNLPSHYLSLPTLQRVSVFFYPSFIMPWVECSFKCKNGLSLQPKIKSLLTLLARHLNQRSCACYFILGCQFCKKCALRSRYYWWITPYTVFFPKFSTQIVREFHPSQQIHLSVLFLKALSPKAEPYLNMLVVEKKAVPSPAFDCAFPEISSAFCFHCWKIKTRIGFQPKDSLIDLRLCQGVLQSQYCGLPYGDQSLLYHSLTGSAFGISHYRYLQGHLERCTPLHQTLRVWVLHLAELSSPIQSCLPLFV